MPAHRKPTALLTKKYRRAAGRDLDSEPQSRGDLTARPRLPRDVAACWDALVRLAPAGVLKDSDAVIVELTARLWAKVRRGEGLAADATQLRTCLHTLGMTPAARGIVMADRANEPQEYRDV